MRVTVAKWERSGRRQPEAGPAAVPSAANAVPQSFAVDAGNWNRSVVPLDAVTIGIPVFGAVMALRADLLAGIHLALAADVLLTLTAVT
jgi:hypothetical protein